MARALLLLFLFLFGLGFRRWQLEFFWLPILAWANLFPSGGSLEPIRNSLSLKNREGNSLLESHGKLG